MSAGYDSKHPANGSESSSRGTGIVLGTFWALLWVLTFLVAGPWAGFHGVLLGIAGLLMLLFPPAVRLPRRWWILAGLFVVLGAAAFLPAAWFPMPPWRGKLEGLGVETGDLVVIQSRQAAEAFTLFAITLFTGLWLAGHRPSSSQARWGAMAFTVGVAIYAIASRITQASTPDGQGTFGFFPNRNHTATYLAMGTLCGLGNVLQALRDRRFLAMGVALAATAVCLWAVAGWSVSRGGVVLVAIGCLLWIPLLGRRYLGRNGLRALGLIALAGVGLFFIADSGVKDRLTKTIDKAGEIRPEAGKQVAAASQAVDFRIPIALDTLDLIKNFKWTGIGAGQYYFIFPQYRSRTVVANSADNYHPESDWLWLAAEAGVPAALAMAALVALAFSNSTASILRGRNRALRSACLVAAMLVPIHGLFDVPGHRITLSLSAALLFALSLDFPSSVAPPPRPRGWPSRMLGLALLAVALLLVRSQWWGGPQPALTAAASALAEARQLRDEDQIMQRNAAAQGREYQPDPARDRLDQALVVLEQSRNQAPLDRDVLRYQAFLAFHFDDKQGLIDRVFAIDRALTPTWVEGPMRQAEAWSGTDPTKTVVLWKESLRRARNLDCLEYGNEWSSARTLERIRQFTKGKPGLEHLVPTAD